MQLIDNKYLVFPYARHLLQRQKIVATPDFRFMLLLAPEADGEQESYSGLFLTAFPCGEQ